MPATKQWVNTWVENPYWQQPPAGQEPPALAKVAEDHGLWLHQNYNWVAPRLAVQIGREFGVKVSIASTLRKGVVAGMRSMPGNPFDGHTLAEALEQVGIFTARTVRRPRPLWTRAIGA